MPADTTAFWSSVIEANARWSGYFSTHIRGGADFLLDSDGIDCLLHQVFGPFRVVVFG